MSKGGERRRRSPGHGFLSPFEAQVYLCPALPLRTGRSLPLHIRFGGRITATCHFSGLSEGKAKMPPSAVASIFPGRNKHSD